MNTEIIPDMALASAQEVTGAKEQPAGAAAGTAEMPEAAASVETEVSPEAPAVPASSETAPEAPEVEAAQTEVPETEEEKAEVTEVSEVPEASEAAQTEVLEAEEEKAEVTEAPKAEAAQEAVPEVPEAAQTEAPEAEEEKAEVTEVPEVPEAAEAAQTEVPEAEEEKAEAPAAQEAAPEATEEHEAAAEAPEAEASEPAAESAAPAEPAVSEEAAASEPTAESAAPAAQEAAPTPKAAHAAQEAAPAAEPEKAAAPAVVYSEMTLAEIVGFMERLMDDPERMKRNKEVDALKSAFYKRLSKEKAEGRKDGASEELPPAAEVVPETVAETAAEAKTEAVPETVSETASETAAEAVTETVPETVPETAAEKAPAASDEEVNPFAVVEEGFRFMLDQYKKQRAEYNRIQEKEREENLQKKEAVIEDLKSLVDKQEDVNATFPAFREIQNRWREIGRVPENRFRDINDTYQFYVEQFYDKVQINREMRDLDFKRNLEVKLGFCEEAEKLAENPNVLEAFRRLQKLHEQWKEYGPVAKEFREEIWERFKAATAVINKKYQAYFEGKKEKYAENLEAKTRLCERVEEIVSKEVIRNSAEWNALSGEIMKIQEEWRKIGFASKKENQKIYDRFRAACDVFFRRKREFYREYKAGLSDNLARKLDLIAQAEALRTSTEWKATTEKFIALQKQWKEIGPVPRKKSEQLWRRFRGACDEFFNAREKNAKPEAGRYGNLKAKEALIEEIKGYQPVGGAEDEAALNAFMERWQAIGFVPFKEKDRLIEAYRTALRDAFPNVRVQDRERKHTAARIPTGKERLIQKYTKLQQDIDTYENNIGFFAESPNSVALIAQMTERIGRAKEELKVLEEQIRQMESQEESF